jgi:DNA-binding PadR family transcriptional regulator
MTIYRIGISYQKEAEVSMFNQGNRGFAFQFCGGSPEDGPPHRRQHEGHDFWHGPRFFGMRMGRGLFGPRGPFGPGGPLGPEGPFWGGQRFFGRGDVKYALLELLQERPMHGYEMMKALEERCGGFYVASAGTIYPTLQMLEDRGLITSSQTDGKKIYSITEVGRAFLGERNKEEESSRRHGFGPSKHWNDPEMQALRSEAMEVTRLFVIAGRMSLHNPEKTALLRTIIERTRKELSDMIYSSSEKPEQDVPPPPANA